jgi:hypothetical protein
MAFMLLDEAVEAHEDRTLTPWFSLYAAFCYPGVHHIIWNKLGHARTGTRIDISGSLSIQIASISRLVGQYACHALN